MPYIEIWGCKNRRSVPIEIYIHICDTEMRRIEMHLSKLTDIMYSVVSTHPSRK